MKTNKYIVKEFINATNQKDWDKVLSLIHHDFIRHDYTPWHSWNIEPLGNHVDKPIVVLTDRYIISAGERAVMAFRTVNNVTFIGDTTNGA